MPGSPTLPTISVVTPTLNRRPYLAAAMSSVLGQGYPNLEYIVVDGGSTDGSVDLIKRRADELAWWVSEPDAGAWEAINKGFAHASGEVMGWLGSDDLLMPWSLSVIGEVFATFPEIEWLTTLFPTECDEAGRPVQSHYLEAYGRKGFFRGENMAFAGWPAAGFIEQEATYWRRSLWERTGGGLDQSLRLAADFELWARFHRAGAELYAVPISLAAFRRHGDQMSETEFSDYVDEAYEVLRRYGGRPPRPNAVPRTRRLLMLLRRRFFPRKGLRLVHDGPGKGWRVKGRDGPR